jgi:hypothetical protein
MNWTVSTATSSQYLQLSVSRFSRQGGILNISQPYRPLRAVTEIASSLMNEAPKGERTEHALLTFHSHILLEHDYECM